MRHEETREALLFPEQATKGMAQLHIFSDLGEDVYIPKPVKDFPPVHFMELAHVQP